MTIFKPLAADDRVSTKTLLHEAIPITGAIVSGTYGTFQMIQMYKISHTECFSQFMTTRI